MKESKQVCRNCRRQIRGLELKLDGRCVKCIIQDAKKEVFDDIFNGLESMYKLHPIFTDFFCKLEEKHLSPRSKTNNDVYYMADMDCYKTRKECLENDDCTKCPLYDEPLSTSNKVNQGANKEVNAVSVVSSGCNEQNPTQDLDS